VDLTFFSLPVYWCKGILHVVKLLCALTLSSIPLIDVQEFYFVDNIL